MGLLIDLCDQRFQQLQVHKCFALDELNLLKVLSGVGCERLVTRK